MSQQFISISLMDTSKKRSSPPPGGLEPPTFRLTAERANRLRHEGRWRLIGFLQVLLKLLNHNLIAERKSIGSSF